MILGLDVAKRDFHAALSDGKDRPRVKAFPNNIKGYEKLFAWLRNRDVERCPAYLESTGGWMEAQCGGVAKNSARMPARRCEAAMYLIVVDVGGTGCPSSVVALSDDRDHTFVVAVLGLPTYGFAGNGVIVRWIDGNGALLTPWTDAGDPGDIHLFPIIGGGVAVEVADRLMSFESGSVTPQPAPKIEERETIRR